MKYRITHKTVYDYVEAALTCHNQVHLTPPELQRQHRLEGSLTVEPTPAAIREHTDFFGNIVHSFDIVESHEGLTITSTNTVDVVESESEFNEAASTKSPPWEQIRQTIIAGRDPILLDTYQFAFNSRYIHKNDVLADYASQSFTRERPILEATMDLTKRINADFVYDPKATTVATSIDEVFESRRGVCQDFAHLQIGCLRSIGLPARYVSGYLRTDPPPGKPRLVGADASHAWISVFVPSQGGVAGEGWIDFDPTNSCTINDRHIVLARGRDYGDVSPIKGVVLGGGEHALIVTVDAAPFDMP